MERIEEKQRAERVEGARPARGTDVPTRWADVWTSSIKTLVVAFVVLQAKEWFDAGRFDTPATAVDAALIAGGVLLVSAMIKVVRSK